MIFHNEPDLHVRQTCNSDTVWQNACISVCVFLPRKTWCPFGAAEITGLVIHSLTDCRGTKTLSLTNMLEVFMAKMCIF